jgi:hypothetical protein
VDLRGDPAKLGKEHRFAAQDLLLIIIIMDP